jgi:hypothetical protein
MAPSREVQLGGLLVRLADTLSDEVDLVELMTVLAEGTVSIMAVDEAGVVLADPRGSLRVVASSSERMRVLELYEIQNEDGPCLECFSSGEAVLNVHLGTKSDVRWPHFSPRARQMGYHVVHAFPIRHRTATIGMVNAFAVAEAELTGDEAKMGEAMAQMAAIGLLHQRALLDRDAVIEQLQHALDARVTVEQAKGILSERFGTSVADAYHLLRTYARRNATPVHSVAAAVLAGEIGDDGLRPE